MPLVGLKGEMPKERMTKQINNVKVEGRRG